MKNLLAYFFVFFVLVSCLSSSKGRTADTKKNTFRNPERNWANHLKRWYPSWELPKQKRFNNIVSSDLVKSIEGDVAFGEPKVKFQTPKLRKEK